MNVLQKRQTIENIEELVEKLKHFYQQATETDLDASKVEQIDTASLQLILAFVIEMKNCGLRVNIRQGSDKFWRAVKLLGMDEQLPSV